MNVLMVGAGSAGSWTIRGHQLGAALGARVTTAPTEADWQWSDVVVLVKRAIYAHGHTAKATGRPVVWDALDFWAQPAANTMTPDEARELALETAALAGRPTIVCATQAMADALRGVYLPHHAWPGLAPARPSSWCSVVAYQGNPAYLGRWAGWLSEACRVRGWAFQINPDDLREADILVALRDGPWNGWVCREWKSGVKLVNALTAGRPVITQESAAWREITPQGALVATRSDLDAALETCARTMARPAAADYEQYQVGTVANHYRTILEGVACPA